MELPILLAADTTANWDKSDAVLGESELAIEYAGPSGKEKSVKYLLVGDGRPVTSRIEHLRVGPGLIAFLPDWIDEESAARKQADEELSGRITAETAAREQADSSLQSQITELTNNPGGGGGDGENGSVNPGGGGGDGENGSVQELENQIRQFADGGCGYRLFANTAMPHKSCMIVCAPPVSNGYYFVKANIATNSLVKHIVLSIGFRIIDGNVYDLNVHDTSSKPVAGVAVSGSTRNILITINAGSNGTLWHGTAEGTISHDSCAPVGYKNLVVTNFFVDTYDKYWYGVDSIFSNNSSSKKSVKIRENQRMISLNL